MTAYLVKLAKMIATEAHADQRDKIGKPYIQHPARVEKYVKEALVLTPEINEEHALCVAWLHDTVEDTSVTAQSLAEEFPDQVVDAVLALTRTEDEAPEAYYARVRSNPLALLVKKADIRDNTDPTRMSQLHPETRQRLVHKYEYALKQLG